MQKLQTTETGGAVTVPKYVRAKVLAERLDVHPRTVVHWAETGAIPFIKLRGTLRFDESAVLAVLERGEG